MIMEGLTKDNSARIGFVVSCLYAEALNIEEMKQWVMQIYEGSETPPTYFVDLLDFKPPLYTITKVIGFVPNWAYSEDEELALFGIAYLRGRVPYDCPLSRDEALLKLKSHPAIEQKFRAEFPFVDLLTA